MKHHNVDLLHDNKTSINLGNSSKEVDKHKKVMLSERLNAAFAKISVSDYGELTLSQQVINTSVCVMAMQAIKYIDSEDLYSDGTFDIKDLVSILKSLRDTIEHELNIAIER